MKMTIYSHANKTHFHSKVLHLPPFWKLGPVYMEWGTPVWWGWFLLFSRSGGHKTKETYPTRPGCPTPCKQGLRVFGTRKWPIIQSHYKIQFDTTRPPSLEWSIEHCVLTPHPRGVLFVDNLSRPTPGWSKFYHSLKHVHMLFIWHA